MAEKSKTKQYKTLKDLPQAKAGVILTLNNEGYYIDKRWSFYSFSREIVEDTPEWFKEINNKVLDMGIYKNKKTGRFGIGNEGQIAICRIYQNTSCTNSFLKKKVELTDDWEMLTTIPEFIEGTVKLARG